MAFEFEFGDLRYVWRHLPLSDIHPHARLAAEAAEAAGAQGAFWPMHSLLLARQDRLEMSDLLAYAAELGLDVGTFRRELDRRAHAGRVERDIASADRSGVSGTPTFFFNGQRHQGTHDLAALTRAIDATREVAEHALVPLSPTNRHLTIEHALTG